jgi:hypothetical protein
MHVELDCPGCGRQLRVIEQFAGRSMHCPSCGTAYRVPARTAPPAAPRAAPPAEDYPPVRPVGVITPPSARTPRDDAAADVYRLADEAPSPPREAPAPAPAAAPPTAAPPPEPAGGANCPACGAATNAGAVVCLDCGFNRQTGKRLKTVSRRVAFRLYSGGLHPATRAAVLAGLLGLLSIPLWTVPEIAENALSYFVYATLAVLLLLLLGTFHRRTVTTDPQGRPVLLKHTWFGFVPTGWSAVELRDYHTIRLTHAGGGGVETGAGLVFPRAAQGCLMGGLGGLVVAGMLRPSGAGLFTLEIRGDDDFVDPVRVYRGRSERTMRRLGDALEEIAGLRYG